MMKSFDSSESIQIVGQNVNETAASNHVINSKKKTVLTLQ